MSTMARSSSRVSPPLLAGKGRPGPPLAPYGPWANVPLIRLNSGPTLALVLARPDAVEAWKTLIGPTDAQEARDVAPQR